MDKHLEKLVRKQDFVCRNGAKDWRDGFLLGNGNLAAVASAPGHLEWVINKGDIFDPTSAQELLEKIIPHDEFLRRVEKMSPKTSLFLNQIENAPFKGKRQKDTMSACILRLSSWYGIGWSAPPMPQTICRLSLYDAILEERMESHNLNTFVRAFIPRHREVFCLRFFDASAEPTPRILEVVRPADARLSAPIWHTEIPGLNGFTQELPGGGRFYAVAARFSAGEKQRKETSSSAEGLTGTLTCSGECDLFLAVKTGKTPEEAWNSALTELEDACSTKFEKLESDHKKWWHTHWKKCAYADFGAEEKIQKAYTFSLYELACVYGKAPVPGLNGMAYGPLNERVPGVSCQGYAHDQNAQISALALIPSNNKDLFCAYADTYLAMIPRLRENTKKTFHCDGVYLPLCTNQLGSEYPTRSYRYTLCGSAYTGMVLSYAWRYFRDKDLLRKKIYPLLREFVIFYSHIVHKGKDGIYHLDWSVPPEIFTLTRDELSSISLLKVCLETAIEGAELLGQDKSLVPVWKEILAHYPPFSRRADGAYWSGPDIPQNHFFYGGHTLYPFFPAACDNDVEAAQKTLDYIEKAAIERSFADRKGMFHMNHDWSMFVITAANLRAGNRKKGWKLFRRFLELFGKENGLFSHDPILIGDVKESIRNENELGSSMLKGQISPTGEALKEGDPYFAKGTCVTSNPDAKRLAPSVLEGNSAFVFLASETLLQSHGGELHLFPGVPKNFTGSFVNFPAQGGFFADASMVNGRIRFLRLRAPYGGTCRIRNLRGKKVALNPDEVFEATY